MIARYADTAHFRAPYKEVYLNGMGVVAPPKDITYQDARGWRMLTPEVVRYVMSALQTAAYVIVPSPEHAGITETVEVYAPGDEQQTAITQGKQLVQGVVSWVDAQVAAGKVVLFSFSDLRVPAKLYAAVKDEAVIRMLSQEAPVLAEPTSVGLGPVLIGVAVVLVAGGWLLFRAHRHQPNVGRRRRR